MSLSSPSTWAWRVLSHTDAINQLFSVSTSTICQRSWSWLTLQTPLPYNASKTQALWRSPSRTQKLKDLQNLPSTWSPWMSSIFLSQRPSTPLWSPSTPASSPRSARSSNLSLNHSPSWQRPITSSYQSTALLVLDSWKFNRTREIEKRSKLWSKLRSQSPNNLRSTT